MKKYSVFHPLWMSFFSKDFYLDVLRNWKGISFLYLLILVVIVIIPPAIHFKQGVSAMVRESPKIVEQMPEITIKGGVVSTPENRPYFIRDPKEKRAYGIIDTSGRYLTVQGTDAVVLMTRNRLFLKHSEVETRQYDLSNITELRITRSDIAGWIDWADKWIVAGVVFFMVIGLYIWKVIAALIYTVICLIITSIMKVTIPYSSKLSLAIIAMTPVSLLIWVFDFFKISIPYEWLLSLAATTFFMAFGIYMNKGSLEQK